LEGAWKLKTGDLLSFAEQQLVDCIYFRGCAGGLQETAFDYYETHNAILAKDYKYTAQNGQCLYGKVPASAAKTTGYVSVKANNVDQMKAALAKTPLSVSIDADAKSFGYY